MHGVDVTDAYNRTALYYAAERGHSEIFELIVSGLDFKHNKNAENLMKALEVAAANAKPKIVARLCALLHTPAGRNKGLLYHPLLLAVEGDDARAPQHSKSERMETIRSLVVSGAELESEMRRLTPLYVALRTGSPYVIQLLLDLGANPLALKYLGVTALHLAARRADFGPEIINIILQHPELSPLNVDALDDEDKTALHLAVQEGNASSVGVLIKTGASMFRECYSKITGQTKSVLGWALERHDREILSVLIKEGSKFAKLSLPEDVSAYFELWRSELAMIQLAALHGFQGEPSPSPAVDKAFANGETLLHLAAELQAAQVITALLQSWPSVDLADADGRTALHIAFSHLDVYSIVVLLAGGASQTIWDKDGLTPLHRGIREASFLHKKEQMELFLHEAKQLQAFKAAKRSDTFMYLATLKETHLTYSAELNLKVRNKEQQDILTYAASLENEGLLQMLKNY